jgi:hypothetical protein
MIQVLVYGSEDLFSYDDVALLYQKWCPNEEQAKITIANYKEYFGRGKLSCMHILAQKIHHKNGVVEVVENSYGENPLKVRVVINPEALEIKQKSVKISKLSGGTLVPSEAYFTTTLAGATTIGPVDPSDW